MAKHESDLRLTEALAELPRARQLAILRALAFEFSDFHSYDTIAEGIDEIELELARESVAAASGRDALTDPHFPAIAA